MGPRHGKWFAQGGHWTKQRFPYHDKTWLSEQWPVTLTAGALKSSSEVVLDSGTVVLDGEGATLEVEEEELQL